jgi:hypothetical protein
MKINPISLKEVLMNRVKFTLLSADLVLAMAFTFSCSGDGGEEGGRIEGGRIDPSEYLSADRQVYMGDDATKKFGGGGTVYFDSYGKIEIGKIESGKLKLTLPNIKGEYPELLKKWDFCFMGERAEERPPSSGGGGDLEDVKHKEQKESCADPGYSISPANLTYYLFLEGIRVDDQGIRVDVPGKNDCRMSLNTVKSGKWNKEARTDLYYFSAPGNTTGIVTDYSGKSDDDVYIYNFNLSISEGWNFVYYVHVPDNDGYYTDGYYKSNVTTSLPAGNTLEWGLECW